MGEVKSMHPFVLEASTQVFKDAERSVFCGGGEAVRAQIKDRHC